MTTAMSQAADRASDAKFAAEILPEERKYVDAWRTETGRRQPERALTGLALSGGGIRSAVYCLGAIQALAQAGLLQRFDYLSTVSGGGYIGSSLTWCTSRKINERLRNPFGTSAADLPFDIDDPLAHPRQRARHNSILRHLRRHGSYLVPGGGIGWTSGAAIVLRGLILNIVVIWLPLITVAFSLMRAVHQRVLPMLNPLWLGLGFLVLFSLASIVYSLWSRVGAHHGERGVPYLVRRCFEEYAWLLLWPAGGFVVLGSLPVVLSCVGAASDRAGIFSTAMTALGAASGVWSRFVPQGPGSVRVPSFVGPVGATLLLYGISLLGYWLSVRLFPHMPDVTALPNPYVIAVLVAALAVLVGWLVNLNYVTLHRYYRDRLMEAFMPAIDDDGAPVEDVTKAADQAKLHEMCRLDAARAPYHLMNAHLVLTSFGKHVSSRERRWQLRGGDSFLLSPRYCGSAATGWCKTEEFMAGNLTLATAMAISGAAINPNAATAGVGPERSTSFAILMSLLNIRLGFWAPNPRLAKQGIVPNHFRPALQGLVDKLSRNGNMVELADGGDFDNLGVYELLRRRVRTIVVCDATADPDYAFSDLQNLLSRAEADFGVSVTFRPPPPLSGLMPSLMPGYYPQGVPFSKAAFAVADIAYDPSPSRSEPATGTLYYVKPAIFPSLRLQILGFKSANPAFPADTTVNQFFSEARFEAYRELGFASMSELLKDDAVIRALTEM